MRNKISWSRRKGACFSPFMPFQLSLLTTGLLPILGAFLLFFSLSFFRRQLRVSDYSLRLKFVPLLAFVYLLLDSCWFHYYRVDAYYRHIEYSITNPSLLLVPADFVFAWLLSSMPKGFYTSLQESVLRTSLSQFVFLFFNVLLGLLVAYNLSNWVLASCRF